MNEFEKKLNEIETTKQKLSNALAVEEERIKNATAELKEFGIENVEEAEQAINMLEDGLSKVKNEIDLKMKEVNKLIEELKQLSILW